MKEHIFPFQNNSLKHYIQSDGPNELWKIFTKTLTVK